MAKLQAIKFKNLTKHGTLQFPPGVTFAFEDPDAAPYFIKAGFAEKSSEEPTYVYPKTSIDVDPETIFADGPRRGQKVMEG